MLIEQKKSLIALESYLIESLNLYNQYEFDLTYKENDFSKEILLIKTLNIFDQYKRAIKQFNNIPNDNLEFLEKQILEKLESVRLLKDKKFEKLLNNYFSDKRLNAFIIELKEETFSEFPDKYHEKSYNSLLYIINVIDNMKIAVKSENSIYKNYKDLFKSNYLSFKEIVKSNYLIFSYYSEEISNIANNLLIPNDADNQWWFSYKPIDSEKFEYVISKYAAKQKENEWVTNLVCELGENSKEAISELKNDIKNAINWGRGNLESFDLLIQGFMQDKQVAPSYATWSEENKPINSDHGMHAIVLKKVASMNHEIIDDLIQLAESPDNEISQRKKNEIIATAYLLIGETQKAMDILDSD